MLHVLCDVKVKMNWFPWSWFVLTLLLLSITKRTSVTDKQTDKHTDLHAVSFLYLTLSVINDQLLLSTM